MRKKITLAEWNRISRYNHAKKIFRPMCVYTLTKEANGAFRRDQYIGLVPYFLLFIPLHVAEFFVCCWDGGLREFEIIGRHLGADYICTNHENYKTAEGIYNGGV